MLLGLTGCGGSDGQEDEEASTRSATLRNPGTGERMVRLSINGRPLVSDIQALLREAEAIRLSDAAIRNQPSEARGFALALWSLLVRDRYHFDPITAEQWGHSPVLLLNSIGFGFCDDAASAYVALARAAGYEARVWGVEGHVVPEILVDERWELYDPDLEVYYLDEQGNVCGVEQLANRPDLITSPTLGASTPLPGAPQRDPSMTWISGNLQARYSKSVADIYSSIGDNAPDPWYSTIPGLDTAATLPLILPAGASISVGMRAVSTVVGYWGYPVPAQGALQLSLPASSSRVLELPLLPVDVRGSGRVRIDGVEYAVGSVPLSERLHSFVRPVRFIELIDCPAGVTVEYLLNPKRFALHRLRDVRLEGDAQGLELHYSDDPLS